MYDAVIMVYRLVELCGQDSDIITVPASELEEALALYEKYMFERGQDLIRRSKMSESMLFDENGEEKFPASMRGECGELFYDGKTSTCT